MKLIEYSDSYKTNINNYFLTEEMTYYTGIPKDCIAISEEMPSFHSILAFSDNNELVTFFVLDEGEDKTLYTDNLNSMLLRSFSTDSHHIKKGFAKEALGLLADFVRVNFPHINEIVLAVNEKNIAAQTLYLRVGFKDNNIRVAGPKGKLFVLTMVLK